MEVERIFHEIKLTQAPAPTGKRKSGRQHKAPTLCSAKSSQTRRRSYGSHSSGHVRRGIPWRAAARNLQRWWVLIRTVERKAAECHRIVYCTCSLVPRPSNIFQQHWKISEGLGTRLLYMYIHAWRMSLAPPSFKNGEEPENRGYLKPGSMISPPNNNDIVYRSIRFLCSSHRKIVNDQSRTTVTIRRRSVSGEPESDASAPASELTCLKVQCMHSTILYSTSRSQPSVDVDVYTTPPLCRQSCQHVTGG